MSNVSKYVKRAGELLKKGKGGAALREYLEALRENPADETAAQAAADLYLTFGNVHKAAELWAGLLDRQLASGQNTAAVASYRKLMRMTTPAPETSWTVAAMLEKSNHREALEAYQAAMAGFRAAGRTAEALGVVERILALEPSIPGYCRLGELADELGDPRKAAAAFLKAGELQSRVEGRTTEALQHFALAQVLDPRSVDVAVAYARALLEMTGGSSGDKAVSILQPFANGPHATTESRALFGRALVEARRARDAEPYFWEMVRYESGRDEPMLKFLTVMLGAEQVPLAVSLARKWEQFQQRNGRIREHAGVMAEFAAQQPPRIEFLVYLAELFSTSGRESDYSRTLLQLFEFYFEAGNFLRAVECLDRAVEVDPHAPGFAERLEKLRGKVDEKRRHSIAVRLGLAKEEPATAPEAAAPKEAQKEEDLEDLVLQAEIFLQYGLRPRAVELLERIRRLFPGEEQKNEKLRELAANAGLAAVADIKPASETKAEEAPILDGAAAAADGGNGVAGNDSAVVNITRTADITRKIYRQGNVRSVLLTAANETGQHWNVSRCAVVMCSPGKPPTVAMEYCSPGIAPSHVHTTVKLVERLQPLVMSYGVVAISDDSTSPDLRQAKQFAASLGIRSILATPLVEEDQHIGLLLLMHCGVAYNWRSSDLVMLRAIAEQTVLALANARLRNLVKNLGVTEEKSGLLKRASYLDILLAEVRRAAQNNSHVTLMLLNFGKAQELVRQAGEAAVEGLMQRVGQLVCAHIRQNDVAVRYDLTTVALVLADTDQQNSYLTLDRLRNVMGDLCLPDQVAGPRFSCGIAEARIDAEFDPVDMVTEVINRAEEALREALKDRENRVRALAPAEFELVPA